VSKLTASASREEQDSEELMDQTIPQRQRSQEKELPQYIVGSGEIVRRSSARRFCGAASMDNHDQKQREVGACLHANRIPLGTVATASSCVCTDWTLPRGVVEHMFDAETH